MNEKELEKFLNATHRTNVAVFDDATNKRIEAFVKRGYCKVPTLVKNRTDLDTLPWHFTVRDFRKQEVPQNMPNTFVVNEVRLRQMPEMGGAWNLHLNTNVCSNDYKITLCFFTDPEVAQKEFERVKQIFQPFIGKIVSINTYDIYPAKLVTSRDIE